MRIWRSLSGRLLLLTLLFVMLAEVLIFAPSVARFRFDYLSERLDKGQLAGLAASAAGASKVASELETELLKNAEVYSVVLKRDQARELMLMKSIPEPIGETFDLRDPGGLELIYDALRCALQPEPRFIRVIGEPSLAMEQMVEVVIDESFLRSAMLDYGLRIFWLSLLISVFTAGLVYLSVLTFVVRPMRRVIDGVVSFREAPEDASRMIVPSGVGGEIGDAERELAAMQTELRAALQQKSHLASLGEAVAKINHDLRNMLASAQLLADRLESSTDPLVTRIGPKLLGSLDRAIRLCTQTLAYGAADEPPPVKQPLLLSELFREIGDALALHEAPNLRFEAEAPAGLMAPADPDQLFRAVLNLARNAQQALETQTGEGAAVLRLEARHEGEMIEIDVVDNGAGLPQAARDNLFKPFQGSVRKGGSGLGLAIAKELANGHGGSLTLVSSGAEGTRFRLSLPAAPCGDHEAKRGGNEAGKPAEGK